MAEEMIRLTDEERKRRRRRSIALGLMLAVLVVLIYFVTMAKIGPTVMDRPL